eukprot:1159040-Pelagomonas_calceolata.AAC.6
MRTRESSYAAVLRLPRDHEQLNSSCMHCQGFQAQPGQHVRTVEEVLKAALRAARLDSPLAQVRCRMVLCFMAYHGSS